MACHVACHHPGPAIPSHWQHHLPFYMFFVLLYLLGSVFSLLWVWLTSNFHSLMTVIAPPDSSTL